MGLKPLPHQFAYIKLNGRLTLYAKRDAADQLRKLHGISIDKPDIEFVDDLVMVTVTGRDKSGRTDSDLGTVSIDNLRGEQKANAILKAITKAKRRLTLSIVGLGWLDETEVETIPGAQVIAPEAIDPEPQVVNLDFMPDFDDIRRRHGDKGWGEVRYLATQHLGYENDFHAKNTLKKVFNGNAGDVTYEAAWQALVDHQRAKVENGDE